VTSNICPTYLRAVPGEERLAAAQDAVEAGRRQGLTLVPIPAQLEHTLPLSAQLKLTVAPIQTNVTLGRVPKVLKLSSEVSNVSRRSSRVSFEVSECKPLGGGAGGSPLGGSGGWGGCGGSGGSGGGGESPPA
jgi:uncharacterized membrane protein YgcG